MVTLGIYLRTNCPCVTLHATLNTIRYTSLYRPSQIYSTLAVRRYVCWALINSRFMCCADVVLFISIFYDLSQMVVPYCDGGR